MSGLTRLTHFALMVLLISISGFTNAQSLPSEEPILRINQIGHSDRITQLELTPDQSKILTISVDKTLKIWRSEDLQLLNTVRMPIENGFEGSLYALAVSPDGKLAAISGWTGYTYEKSISIYLVDIVSGHFVGRIAGMDEIVTNMRFDPVGKFLYVALNRKMGLRVVDINKQEIVAEDRDYQATTIGIEFLPNQVVSTSSHDGKLRFYDREHQLISTRSFDAASLPTANRATTDGRYMALGFMGVSKVVLFDMTNNKPAIDADPSCFKDQDNTPRVFWNEENTFLYAYGSYEGTGSAPLYRWKFKDGQLGPCERIETTRRNFTDIDIMSGSRFAIATTEPSVGIFSTETGKELVAGNPVPDFRRSSAQLRISHAGDKVLFPVSPNGKLALFSLFDKEIKTITASQIDSGIFPGRVEVDQRSGIEGAFPGRKISIGGQVVPLAESEVANDAIVAPGGDAYVATEFGVVIVRNNQLIARRNTPSHVEAIALSGDGEVVVTLLADGTVRWFRSDTLEPVLSLFSNAGSNPENIEWVSWVPEGYYVSSNNGDSLIGWHLNNGVDQVSNFYPALQYERVLYSPAIVNDMFNSRARMNEKTGSLERLDLREISPGVLDIEVVEVQGKSATVKVSAKKRSLDLQTWAVLVNEIPVLTSEQRVFSKNENNVLSRTLKIPLFAVENHIRVEISNGQSFAIAEIDISLNEIPSDQSKGDLYLVSIGVGEFPYLAGYENMDLEYTYEDASEFVRVMRQEGNTAYNNIYVREISDYAESESDILWPTKKNILDSLELVTQATALDTVIIFLASHGFSDNDGNYYFVPRDAREEDVDRILDGGSGGESLIAWDAFLDVMRRTSGKRVLVVDTCSARNIDGPQDTHSLAKRSASARFGLLAAAKGDEESLGSRKLGQGLFTWSLIQAIEGNSDLNGDREKSLAEVFEFSRPILESLRPKDRPQTPQLIAPDILRDMTLVRG